jgi:hypothetical protein
MFAVKSQSNMATAKDDYDGFSNVLFIRGRNKPVPIRVSSLRMRWMGNLIGITATTFCYVIVISSHLTPSHCPDKVPTL